MPQMIEFDSYNTSYHAPKSATLPLDRVDLSPSFTCSAVTVSYQFAFTFKCPRKKEELVARLRRDPRAHVEERELSILNWQLPVKLVIPAQTLPPPRCYSVAVTYAYIYSRS